MTIAVSGTRRPLTEAEQIRVRYILFDYAAHVLHIGDCPTGVDAFVRSYWPENRRQDFLADWTRGPLAGPIRNGRMLQGCEVLIAFPAVGHQKGTMNAIEQAIRAGLEVHVYPLGLSPEGKSP